MTVEQLIKKLRSMPSDAIVTVYNDDLYINGEYKATDIEVRDNTVVIVTDYENIVDEWDV